MRSFRPSQLALVLPLGLVALFALGLGCGDDGGPPPDAGTVSIANDQGIDFSSGALEDPGNYANSDIFATANGDSGMKVVTGGNNPTHNRPITWFRTGGGIAPQFSDLASVPSAPAPTAYDALVHAKSGNGFLVRAANGDLVRGWLSSATANTITVQWERIPTE
jgi:hypothetical protein